MNTVKFLIFLKFVIVVLFYSNNTFAANNEKTKALAQSYANLVSYYYNEVHIKTNNMHKSINMFLKYPTEENLQYVKNKWIEARKIYGITEAFRLY